MPLRFLGGLGSKLPVLEEDQWSAIFEFMEFFVIAENLIESNNYTDINFDWKRMREILQLLGKSK